MKRTSGLLVIALAAACFHHASPRDASGRVVLDRNRIRHPANTPFWCFTYTSAIGEHLSECSDHSSISVAS